MGNLTATQAGGGKQVLKGGNTNIKIGGTIIIIGIVIAAFFLGKGIFFSPQKQIIGTWQNEDGIIYVFGSNGQFSYSDGLVGSYAVDGNVLTITPIVDEIEIYRIEIQSDSLTLYSVDGELYMKLKKFK